MLLLARMKLGASAVITATLLVGSSSAFAGIFVGLGVGTGPNIKDATGEFDSTGRTHRLEAGYSIPVLTGHLAIEGAYAGLSTDRDAHAFDGSNMWLAGRYNHPLGNNFELFGRLGVQRTTLSYDYQGTTTGSYTGKGPVIGVGAEYHLPIKLGLDLSVWMDLDYEKTSLDSDLTGRPALGDSTFHVATLGVSVGF